MAAYFALQQMPLSVQKLIISARPIFTVILARIFLKEPFGKIDVSLILLENEGNLLCCYFKGGDNTVNDTWSDPRHPASIHLPRGQEHLASGPHHIVSCSRLCCLRTTRTCSSSPPSCLSSALSSTAMSP